MLTKYEIFIDGALLSPICHLILNEGSLWIFKSEFINTCGILRVEHYIAYVATGLCT